MSQEPRREWVALDLETTGLDPSSDRVIEVGALRFDPAGETLDTIESLVNPLRDSSAAALQVHQIPDEEVRQAPLTAVVLPRLLDWLGDPGQTTLIAHNAAVDAGFLGMELTRAGLSWPEFRVVDSLAWVRRLHPDWKPVRLSALANRLGYEDPVNHRALADCRRLLHLFLALRRDDDQFATRPPLAYPIHDGRDPAPTPVGWHDLARAIEQGAPVEIVYEGGTQGPAPRIITPTRFEFRGGVTFLVAICHRDGKVKEFQVDQINQRLVLPGGAGGPAGATPGDLPSGGTD